MTVESEQSWFTRSLNKEQCPAQVLPASICRPAWTDEYTDSSHYTLALCTTNGHKTGTILDSANARRVGMYATRPIKRTTNPHRNTNDLLLQWAHRKSAAVPDHEDCESEQTSTHQQIRPGALTAKGPWHRCDLPANSKLNLKRDVLQSTFSSSSSCTSETWRIMHDWRRVVPIVTAQIVFRENQSLRRVQA